MRYRPPVIWSDAPDWVAWHFDRPALLREAPTDLAAPTRVTADAEADVQPEPKPVPADATDEEIVEKNPARKLIMPKIRKKPCERFLSMNELRALLAQAPPREHLVLRTLAVCGLRPAEALVLRIEDFEATQLRTPKGKPQ